MTTQRLFLKTAWLIWIIFLPACAPSQAEIDATASQAAAYAFATQTAEAPTATSTYAPTPTASSTSTTTPVPPTRTATETPPSTAMVTHDSGTAPGSSSSPVLPIKTVILQPEEWAEVLPSFMCMMNAFKESETFSGYMCFVPSKAVGTTEAVMLIYVLTTCPADAPCPQAKPDTGVSHNTDGSNDLIAKALGYSLNINLSAGDAELARQMLTKIADLQFDKIRRGG